MVRLDCCAFFIDVFVWTRCPSLYFVSSLDTRALNLSRHISQTTTESFAASLTRVLTSLCPFFFCQPRIFAFLIYLRRDPPYSIYFKPNRVIQTYIPNPSLESWGVQTSSHQLQSHQLHIPILLVQ